MTTVSPVTVAVSGEEAAALAFAVGEARRTNRAVRLVHVVDQVGYATPLGPVLRVDDVADVAQRILDRAVGIVRRLSEDTVPIETVLHRGLASQALVEESRDSHLLVLEHRALSRMARLFTGSTSTSVAARAVGAVVSVPEGWSAVPRHDRVVVGLDEHGDPEQALDAGFEEAHERGASLDVLHAWRIAPAYEDLVGDHAIESDWRRRTAPAVHAAVWAWSQKHPEVPVRTELRYAAPVDALAAASEDADLLVLGRRTHRGPLRIGSLARAMIRLSHAPVMVVPVPDTSGTGEEREREGRAFAP